MRGHRCAGLLVAVLTAAAGVTSASAQEADAGEATIVGWVFDVESSEPVAGLTVSIPGTVRSEVTNEDGRFRLPGVSPGPSVILRFEHIAYGVQSDTVAVAPGTRTMLRISLAKEAIGIDPLVVSVRSEAERRERREGASFEVITEEELAHLAPRHRGIEGVLKQEVPAIRISDRGGPVPGIPGVYICVEYRGVAKSLRGNPPCRYPLVILDGVRIDDAVKIEALVSTLEISDIHRIEVIPPAAAGVEYGTGSQNGVLVIETKLRSPDRAPSAAPSGIRPPPAYDWALEPEGHPTWRTLGATTLGNAAGLALGLWIADRCIDFDRLHMDFFDSTCGDFGAAGTRLAALALPLLGSTAAARYVGRTELSRGKWGTTAAMGLMTLVPGYILAGTGFGERDTAARTVGKAMLVVGVPLVTTLADKLFREIRASGGR